MNKRSIIIAVVVVAIVAAVVFGGVGLDIGGWGTGGNM